MLALEQLAMDFGGQILFEEVNLNLNQGKRYGLVGANGSGKSTLLRLISGLDVPVMGNISFPKHSRLGWLKQDQYLYEQTSVLDVVLQGKQRLWHALTEKETLLNDTNDSMQIGIRLGELEEIIQSEEGYSAHAFAHTLLGGLGISTEYHTGPLSALSGGYKLRVLLAQALFSQGDILLLDEPTNHLDILSIAWLTQFLIEEYKGILLFVSHDRGFLDNTSTNILDIDYHTIIDYPGNYAHFVNEKQRAYAEQEKIQRSQQEKIDQLQTFVKRFGAKASKAKQAKAKAKQIERIEQVKLKPSTRKIPLFLFKPYCATGKIILTVEHLAKSFGENNVLNDVSFTIRPGEKIAIIGKNGLGKSTLLKILMNKLDADTGEFAWGHKTLCAYFAQDHHEMLKDNMQMLNWLTAKSTAQTSARIRQTLGQVLFSNDAVQKMLPHLSGGEGARLLLARIVLAQHNVLILDEPTNHLDLEGVQALATALQQYQGTVIVVSHDSYFIKAIARRILALTPEGLRDFHGNYDAYNAQYADLSETSQAQMSTNTSTGKVKKTKSRDSENHFNKSKANLEKQIAQVQDNIERLEKDIVSVDVQLAEPKLYEQNMSNEVEKLNLQKMKFIEQLEKKTKRWERLMKQLDQNL